MPGLNNWYTATISDSSFDLTFDFSNVKLMSKKDAIDYTVSELVKNHENIYLCLSGGMDSEFAAKCLYDRGVKFTPLIIDYESNSSEAWYAYYWCHKNKIKPDVIKITRDEVVHQFYQIASKYQVGYLNALEFIAEEYVSKRNGSLLNANAMPFIREYCYNENLNTPISTIIDWYSYCFPLDIEYPNKHPTGFIVYTPEMVYSNIKHLDYSKSPTLSLADYYEVEPRPKISAVMNLFMNQQAIRDFLKIHRTVPLYRTIFGEKDEVITRMENREIIYEKSILLTPIA